MKKVNYKKIIENFIIPLLLLIVCFCRVNQGVDLTDAGYNIDFFRHYEDYSGQAIIAMWGSVLVGHLFTLLPLGGGTWLGITVYCQGVLALLGLSAYFFCKKYFNPYLVAIAEALALLYCWNPSVVLYDYLSFLLFQVGLILLVKGIEKDSWKWMGMAGLVLGLDVFVRIPNVVYCASIGVLWLYAIWDKRKIGWTIRRSLICICGYGIGALIPFTLIVNKYGWKEFKIAIYNLFALSGNSGNYGIGYMATETLRTIFTNWYRMKLSWNPTTQGMLSITSFILLLGIILCFIDLFISKQTIYRVLDVIFLGVLYVTPLGSNNGVYLSMLNMFLLLPIELAVIGRLLDKVRNQNKYIGIACKSISGVVMVVLGMEIVLFGAKFTWKDSPDTKIVNQASYLNGMVTDATRAAQLQEMESFFQENHLNGKYGIMYCDAPALAAILDLKPVMLSQWADWTTFTDDNFEKGIMKAERLIAEQQSPIVILNRAYYEVYTGEAPMETTGEVWINMKYYLLAKYLRDYNYAPVYYDEEFIVYMID